MLSAAAVGLAVKSRDRLAAVKSMAHGDETT
jgi:hypothetical protein